MGLYAGKMLDIYSGFPATTSHRAIHIGYSHWKRSAANEQFLKPESGFALSFHDFGNPAILGYGIGLQYQIKFRQALSDRIRIVERFRPGIIYNNKPFHFIDNTANIVTGSHFSALMGASVGLEFKLSNQLLIGLEGTIWHSSNGHTALPNVGMNSPLGMLSLQYQFAQSDSVIRPIKPTRYANTISLVLQGSLGLNEAGGTTRPVNGKLYPKTLAGIGVAWRTRAVHRWTLTLEGYYDRTYHLWNETQEWTQSNVFWESSALMLMFGHEWVYQRWGLVINGGINLYNPTLEKIASLSASSFGNTAKQYIPGRFAIRYYFSHPWKKESSGFVQMGIKSNYGQADFLEMGVGYIISGRKNKS